MGNLPRRYWPQRPAGPNSEDERTTPDPVWGSDAHSIGHASYRELAIGSEHGHRMPR